MGAFVEPVHCLARRDIPQFAQVGMTSFNFPFCLPARNGGSDSPTNQRPLRPTAYGQTSICLPCRGMHQTIQDLFSLQSPSTNAHRGSALPMCWGRTHEAIHKCFQLQSASTKVHGSSSVRVSCEPMHKTIRGLLHLPEASTDAYRGMSLRMSCEGMHKAIHEIFSLQGSSTNAYG